MYFKNEALIFRYIYDSSCGGDIGPLSMTNLMNFGLNVI